jgi:hypothetical protein
MERRADLAMWSNMRHFLELDVVGLKLVSLGIYKAPFGAYFRLHLNIVLFEPTTLRAGEILR